MYVSQGFAFCVQRYKALNKMKDLRDQSAIENLEKDTRPVIKRQSQDRVSSNGQKREKGRRERLEEPFVAVGEGYN